MKVRYLEFREPVDLPGADGKKHAMEWDPERPTYLGYDMTADWSKRAVRLAVPPAYQERNPRVGAWTSPDGRKVYGRGGVRYVPFEDIRFLELVDDAEPAPKTKAAPAPSKG